MTVRINRNTMINGIIGQYMQEQGFELRTDKRSFWEWSKDILEINETVTIKDESQLIQLYFGNGVGKQGYVFGDKLLHTIDNQRTTAKQWNYWKYEGDLKELYTDILWDIRDIIAVNWESILQELAIEEKKRVPNQRHFVMYRDNFEAFASECLRKYHVEGESVGTVFETVMTQISTLFGKELEETEDILVGLAAMLEKTVVEQFGGKRKISESAIVVTDIGKTRQIYNFLLWVFHTWENPLYFEDNKEDFLSWYRREEGNA